MAVPLSLFESIIGGVASVVVLSVAGAVLLAGVIWLIILELKNRSHRLEITTFRTRQTDGLFRKVSTEVQHDDVTNLRVTQSFLERIFSVGYIGISAGDATKMEIEAFGMPDPEGIATVVREHQNKMTT